MRAKKRVLIPKADFTALVEDAKKSNATTEESHTKVWFTLADQILCNWNGVSYSFLDALTPGQYALVCSAQFYRGTKGQDFLSVISMSEELASRTLRAFEILQAQEYLHLLRQVEAVFPGKQFPKYAEDILWAVRKQPSHYFDEVGDKFVTGKGMQRPLYEYVFTYVTAHPEDFCSA
jgi:hypothetical protein